MKLLIISHTEHYENVNGELVGWGSTITELNFLATIFEEIYHIAVYRKEGAPPSSLPYTSENIHFIPIPSTGGENYYHKLNILWNAPLTILKVFKTLKNVDVFQLRTPTGIGVYLIPLLTLFSGKKGWYKYAGNWVQKKPPFGYRLQRWFLKNQLRKVTINGKWDENIQPKQCITFENPCLTIKNRKEGFALIQNKKFDKPYTFCFVGRLEDQKGVRRILEAFSKLNEKSAIRTIHLIGNGDNMEEYEIMAKKTGVHFVFHGFLNSLDVFEIYKKSHFLLLPSSASEGFPKVIAEAMNFGCIPIVSNVSAIGQYVKQNTNGYIVEPNTSENLKNIVESILKRNEEVFHEMIQRNYKVSSKFTYKKYINRIKSEIIN